MADFTNWKYWKLDLFTKESLGIIRNIQFIVVNKWFFWKAIYDVVVVRNEQ